MKSILLTALSCFFCLGICSQQYYNDTIFTTDKKIPAYIDVSKGNHLRGFTQIKEENKLLENILRLNSETSAILKDTLTDIAGGFHESYVEYYRGIEVEGTRCTIHYKRDGIARNVNGNFRTIDNLSVVPNIDEERALHYALASVGASKYVWEKTSQEYNYPKGYLRVYIKEGHPYLVYKFLIGTIEPKQESLIIYINACDGKVIEKRNAICNVSSTVTTTYSGSQTIESQYYFNNYRLRDYTRGNGIETYNSFNNDYYSSDNTWVGMSNYDRAALDAHWGAEKTYDFYYNNYSRNSYDNNGAVIVSKVNYDDYNNAGWNPSGHYLKYGFYDNLPLVALDIVAHEITHAVTGATSDLVYSGESGAINEGMSDVFAVCIENVVKPLNDYKIWQMGEDITVFRDLRNPHCKYYNGTNWVNTSYPAPPNDYGGIHTNSGVFGYWFYLLAMGGNETNEAGINLPVNGIGLNNAINICYYMNTVYLTSTSDYQDAALCSYLAAEALGYGENVKNQINRAWVNVGVEEPMYYVVGDSEPCGSSVYYVENLPNGYSVTWSSSVIVSSMMTSNFPYSNMCMISNYGTNAFNTYLTATIKNGSGTVVKTVSKKVWNIFDLTFSQEGCTYQGTIYNSIPETTVHSNGTIAVNPVCVITLRSPLFSGMSFSTSGANLNSWSVGNNNIIFSFPYSSSMQTLQIAGSNGCKKMSLTVRARPESLIPIPMLEAHPTPDGITLTLTIENEDASNTQPVWDLAIYDTTSGERVYSNHVERQSIFVNTIGWKRGLYAIKAVVNGEETSCKVIL